MIRICAIVLVVLELAEILFLSTIVLRVSSPTAAPLLDEGKANAPTIGRSSFAKDRAADWKSNR